MRRTPSTDPFSREDAHEAGWTDSALCRAVESGRLTRIRRGYFTAGRAAPGQEARLQAIAAHRACNGSVVSHQSAAILHGIPLLNPLLGRPIVTVRPGQTGDLAGALLHRATLLDTDIVEIDGVPTTSVARTLIDMARATSTASAIVPIDAALNTAKVTMDELDDVMIRCWNWPGIRRAARALRLADPRAESPLESVSRLVLGWLQIPVPVLQQRIGDANGHFLGRLDFYWDELGVGGEADGMQKYDGRPVSLRAEKLRQEELEVERLVIVRWGWTHVTRRPHTLRQRLESGFARAAALDRSGLPRNWSLLPPQIAQSQGKRDQRGGVRAGRLRACP